MIFDRVAKTNYKVKLQIINMLQKCSVSFREKVQRLIESSVVSQEGGKVDQRGQFIAIEEVWMLKDKLNFKMLILSPCERSK